MGYRTNQCQQCGDWGHNRRGCPVIKKAHARVESLAEKYGIDRSEDERAYASTQWITRINEAAQAQDASEDEVSWRDRWLWEEAEERKMAQARKNSRGRQCGFCGERGHNARTCPAKKQHHKDCDAMRGLAHRVVAACLKKAGIGPGALMRKRDWSWKANDYAQVMCMVTGIDWDRVAEPGYDTPQGLPRNADRWFKGAMIRIRMPNGDEGLMRIPQNIQQQTWYAYYEDEDQNWGLVSGVVNGNINKDSGWQGDNVTLLSPEAEGVYIYGHRAEKGDRIADPELQPEIDELVNQVSQWRDY
jgi:hypothetical protein